MAVPHTAAFISVVYVYVCGGVCACLRRVRQVSSSKALHLNFGDGNHSGNHQSTGSARLLAKELQGPPV